MNDEAFFADRCRHELLHGQCAHCRGLDRLIVPADVAFTGAPASLGTRKARDQFCAGCLTEIARTEPVYFTPDRVRVHRECRREDLA